MMGFEVEGWKGGWFCKVSLQWDLHGLQASGHRLLKPPPKPGRATGSRSGANAKAKLSIVDDCMCHDADRRAHATHARVQFVPAAPKLRMVCCPGRPISQSVAIHFRPLVIFVGTAVQEAHMMWLMLSCTQTYECTSLDGQAITMRHESKSFHRITYEASNNCMWAQK